MKALYFISGLLACLALVSGDQPASAKIPHHLPAQETFSLVFQTRTPAGPNNGNPGSNITLMGTINSLATVWG